MDIGSFLADDSIGGSWADTDVDISSIGVPSTSVKSSMSAKREEIQQSFNQQYDDRPKREEFPIPDAPPYRARVGNLPYDVDELSLKKFFEDRMQAPDSVSEVKVPMDTLSGRPKGFAFVTFVERDILEESLNLTLSEFRGRKVFVNVAAPQKQDVFDMDWRGVRGSGIPSRDRENSGRSRRQEAELDWGQRGSNLPPRERSNREGGERRPRREEPDLDWGVARSTTATLPPRERSNRDRPIERKPRREEPDLDWGVARSTTATLPPRERSNRTERPIERKPRKEEPDLDWGVARSTTATIAPRERSERKPRKVEDSFDWKRGQAIEPRQRQASNAKNQPQEKEDKPQGPQKSMYDVLNVEGDDSEDEEEQVEQKKEQDPVEHVTQATSNLTVDSKDDGDWEVVKK